MNFALSSDADTRKIPQLAQGLAEFVFEHRESHGSFSWDDGSLPKGYCNIGVLAPHASARDGKWFYSGVSRTLLAEQDLL